MLIGEVADRTGISARMLRHYDRLGLVSPSERTAGDYRRYSEEDVRRLFHVEGLRSLGMTLQQVAHVLDGVEFSPAVLVEQLIERTRERIADEQELLDRLRQVQASEPSAWSDVLRTIGLVRGLADADPAARQRLALSLAAQDGDDAVPLAEAALAEPDLNVAGTLHWALARGGDRAVPLLAQALRSPDRERRRRAVAALEKIGTPEATAALAEAHRHRDRVVRTRAVLARGRRGEIDAVRGLVDLVVDGRTDVEAGEVLGALARVGDRADAVARAVEGALTGAPPVVRQRLAAALAEVPGERARATLEALSGDTDPGTSLTAAFVLRTRGGAS